MEKPSRSVNEPALDDLKGATMFSDKGVQMKILILSLNGYMKTRDWNVLNKEILQIFLCLFNFMHNVLKFFNKKDFWAFKLEV